MSGADDALNAGGTAYETASDGSTSFQWLRMAVTAESPQHVWHAGKGYPGDAFDGFSAHTDDHVWLEARGGGTTPDGGGTLLAQSEGQAWLQSMEGPLSFVSSVNTVFGTGTEAKSGFKLGAAGGLTIMADSRIVASTASVDDPTASLQAEDKAAEVGGNWGLWWTSVDTAAALGLNLMDRTLALSLNGSMAPDLSFGTLATAMGMCANFAGAGANLYSMIGGAAGADTPPGMTVVGEAGVVIGSKIGVNVWGAPGALLGSAFTTLFGGVGCGAIGGLDCGMASLGPIDMSALVTASITAVARKTGVGIELASRQGTFTAEGTAGVTLTGKDVTARATVTASVASKGWMDLLADKGAVSLKSDGSLAITIGTGLAMGLMSAIPPGGEEISPLAPNDKPLTAAPAPHTGQPQFEITASDGVKIVSGDESSAPILKLSADKVELLVGSDAAATIDAQSVELAVGESSIKASAESLKIDADEVDFS